MNKDIMKIVICGHFTLHYIQVSIDVSLVPVDHWFDGFHVFLHY